LYANLHYFARQTTRLSRRDWTDPRGVSACVASICRGLYHLLSTGQNLARQSTPTEVGRRRQRPLGPGGRQIAFSPRLSEDQPPANHAWLALWAESTPDALLDSSLAPRLATGLSRARYGPGTRCQPGGHQPSHAGGRPRGSPRWDR